MDARSGVAWLLGAAVLGFVIGAMVLLVVLAAKGVNPGPIWTEVVGLVSTVVGALGGFLVGKSQAPEKPPS